MKSIGILAMVLTLGLMTSISVAEAQLALISVDCKSIFPRANSSEAIRTLKSGIQWTEAWEHSSWGPAEEFLGYVFFKSTRHEGKTIGVLVGMSNTGVISKVSIKGLDSVDEKFLAQFRDKTLKDDFDLIRTPEDSHVVPAKIKAMQGNLALSESIAQGVKEIALSARQVIK